MSGDASSSKVLSAGHRFQVGGVHATPIATQVVDLHAGRDWTDVDLVSHTMGRMGTSVDPDAPVASTVRRGRPNPTAHQGVDYPLALEPLRHRPAGIPDDAKRRSRYRIVTPAPLAVVRRTPPTSPRLTITALNGAGMLRHVDASSGRRPWPGLLDTAPGLLRS